MRLAGAIVALLAAVSLATAQSVHVTVLDGRPIDPFATAAKAKVFLFVRTDCPVTNRYAPEVRRISAEFENRGVEFWLVYPDSADTVGGIRNHIKEYRFPGTPLRDTRHEIVRRAEATVAPEAAIFDAKGLLVYTGRIDDRFVEFGKVRPAPTNHDLEAAISATLSGRTVTPAKTRAIGCFLADTK